MMADELWLERQWGDTSPAVPEGYCDACGAVGAHVAGCSADPDGDPLVNLSPAWLTQRAAERLMGHAADLLVARDAGAVRLVASALREEVDALHGLAESLEGLAA